MEISCRQLKEAHGVEVSHWKIPRQFPAFGRRWNQRWAAWLHSERFLRMMMMQVTQRRWWSVKMSLSVRSRDVELCLWMEFVVGLLSHCDCSWWNHIRWIVVWDKERMQNGSRPVCGTHGLANGAHSSQRMFWLHLQAADRQQWHELINTAML